MLTGHDDHDDGYGKDDEDDEDDDDFDLICERVDRRVRASSS